MNYNHLNKISEYVQTNLLPHFESRLTVQSFEDYLKRFSGIPRGRWMRDLDSLQISRTIFAVDPSALAEQYKPHCVAHLTPMKPDEGAHRVIYQMSPTLHFEMAVLLWVEHDVVNSFASVTACYKNMKEYLEFCSEIWKLRRTGNTADAASPVGFMTVPTLLRD